MNKIQGSEENAARSLLESQKRNAQDRWASKSLLNHPKGCEPFNSFIGFSLYKLAVPLGEWGGNKPLMNGYYSKKNLSTAGIVSELVLEHGYVWSILWL